MSFKNKNDDILELVPDVSKLSHSQLVNLVNDALEQMASSRNVPHGVFAYEDGSCGIYKFDDDDVVEVTHD